ncbi:MAG TPA: helix-hairpin-helix domain-containing protein [Fimbriimonas sp.]
MFSHIPPRHQAGYALLAAGTVIGVSWIGGSYLRRPPNITVVQQPLDTEPLAKPAAPAGEPTKSGEVVVHVAGAVKSPKVVRLPAGARVEDALKAAGGPRPDADLDLINLAAKLEDGKQVYIRKKGSAEAVPPPEPAFAGGPAEAATPSSESKPAEARSQTVSLNTGSQAQLESLPGVGPATAKKIIAYRHEHGGFSSIDELLAVKGIGEKKLAAMRRWLKL